MFSQRYIYATQKSEEHMQETNTKYLYLDAITFKRDTLGPLNTI